MMLDAEGKIEGGNKTTTIDIVTTVTGFAIETAKPRVIGMTGIATTLPQVSGSANGWRPSTNHECA